MKPAGLSSNEIYELSYFAGLDFARAFSRWLSEANEVAQGLADLSYRIGKKYIKVLADEAVYGFIDRDGNVLKAESWARPAKNIRGSIYSGKRADGAGPWGVLYMKELLLGK